MSCPQCGASQSASGISYLEKLIAALRHPDPLTQRRAVYLLGQLGDQRAVEALVALLDAPVDPYVRAEAVLALSALGDEKAQAVLLQVKDDETQSVIVRRAAVRVLSAPLARDAPQEVSEKP
ncbi:MAG: HEAT repeat domain-containing protein [Anaerolineae bacterium]|nr:HEAT repeat domain-containing protein [Anaerolineae bacterium]MDW8099505.1 HEAT repeat domain-containing protein [Anaerolineae bacterium]